MARISSTRLRKSDWICLDQGPLYTPPETKASNCHDECAVGWTQAWREAKKGNADAAMSMCGSKSEGGGQGILQCDSPSHPSRTALKRPISTTSLSMNQVRGRGRGRNTRMASHCLLHTISEDLVVLRRGVVERSSCGARRVPASYTHSMLTYESQRACSRAPLALLTRHRAPHLPLSPAFGPATKHSVVTYVRSKLYAAPLVAVRGCLQLSTTSSTTHASAYHFPSFARA